MTFYINTLGCKVNKNESNINIEILNKEKKIEVK